MKELSLNQKEMVSGGKWIDVSFMAGVTCAGTVILAGAFIYGTAGIGAAVGAHAAAWACGGLIRYGFMRGF